MQTQEIMQSTFHAIKLWNYAIVAYGMLQADMLVSMEFLLCIGWPVILKLLSGVFMQGEDASEFMQEVKNLCKRYHSFDEYTAALAYVDNCF